MLAKTDIPRRLDDQWKIGFWDIDVAAPTIFFFFIGYLAGTKTIFGLCLALGLLISRGLSRSKGDKHPAFAMHWLYWHLPTNPVVSMRQTPPAHIRRMVG